MSGFRLLSGYIYPVHTEISQETAIIRMQNTMENGTAGSDVGWHRRVADKTENPTVESIGE